MSTERQIVEKFDGAFRLIFACFSVPVAAMVVYGLFSRISWNQKTTGIAITLGVYLISGIFVKILLKMGRSQKAKWFRTEDGLKRIDGNGNENSVPSRQVKGMYYMSFIGLFIKWDKIQSDVLYENLSSLLCIDKAEANELFHSWQENSLKRQDEDSEEAGIPTHYKRRTLKRGVKRSDARLSANSIFVGVLAVPMAVLELTAGRWPLALSFALVSVTSITLGIVGQSAKYQDKRGLRIRNTLIFLLGILFICILLCFRAEPDQFHK
jgi:hypothetical protein